MDTRYDTVQAPSECNQMLKYRYTYDTVHPCSLYTNHKDKTKQAIIIDAINILLDNIFVHFGNKVIR